MAGNAGLGQVVIVPHDPDLTLRPAGPDDEELAMQLFAASRAAAFMQAGLRGSMLDNMLDQQFRLQAGSYARQFPDARALVIARQDIPVGRLLLHAAEDRWHILDLVLLESCRGKGIGGAVMAGIESAARSHGAGALTLTVLASNLAARRFYARLGFIERVAVAGGAYLNAIKQLAS